MVKKTCSAILLLIVALMCDRAMAQATVVGGQGTYVYVNGQSGSDSNPGSSSQPFQTIQAGVKKALANNKSGVATVVSIAPGVYREEVTMYNTKTSAAITILAATPGTVYVDGANVLTNGSEDGSGVYTYSWTDTVGGCTLPSGWYTGMPPVVQANEMVFIDGSGLNQVMSASLLVPDTFFVNKSTNEIEIDPPTGTNMSTADVEVSARRTTLDFSNVSNVVIDGLVFQHAASCMNVDGAIVNGSSNVLVENIQANWNNWGGFGVMNSHNITLQNSSASNNGGVGFHGTQVLNSLFSNNETDYNNWRGEMIGFYDFAQGGLKLMHTRSVTVNGQTSINNGAQGLWFDTDNVDVTITGATLIGSTVDNLQIEANQGPITIENSSLCAGDVGVNLLESENVTLTGNHFYGNGSSIAAQTGQVFLGGDKGGRTVSNFQTGASMHLVTSGLTMQGNTFTAVGNQQFTFNTYLGGGDWSTFVGSLHSSKNQWYDASTTTVFGLTGGKHVNFANWQTVANDVTSSWGLSSAAQGTCSIPPIAYPDFVMFARNAASYVSKYAMSSAGTVAIPLQMKSFGYGTVTLSVAGLPTGVTASFTSSSLVSGNSTLTLTSYSSATAQTVPITIYATSGSRVHTITEWVVIVPGTTKAPTTPSVATITATPSSLTVPSPGSTGLTALAVAGFSSNAINFSCSGLPQGAACVFGGLQGSGSSGTVALQITTTAASSAKNVPPAGNNGSPAYALGMPGAVALFGLFTTRRLRVHLTRMVVLVVIASTTLWLSGCGVTNKGLTSVAQNSSGGSGPVASGGSGGSGGAVGSGGSGSGSGGGSGTNGGSGSGGSGSGGSGNGGSGSGGSGSGSGGSGSGNGGSGSGGSGSGSGGSGSGSGGSGSGGSGSGGSGSGGSGSGGSGSGGSGSGGSGSGGSGSGGSGSGGSGSGGSGSGGSGSGGSGSGTPLGKSTVTVTATSATQTASVMLTVQVQ